MTSPDDEDRARSYASPPKRRRRYSVWTLLAPASALVLWIAFFSALGQSCIFKECSDSGDSGAQTVSEGDERNDLARGTKSKVKDGDTIGAIAAKFALTEEELKACNPKVDPQSLQAGQYLTVSAVDCEEADKAETGANPDPLAGETATSVPDPAANGTAAADPSVQAQEDATADAGSTDVDAEG